MGDRARAQFRMERDQAMALKYRRPMYSGKQFVLTMAALAVGLIGYTAVKSAVRARTEANGGEAEMYMVDPYSYATSAAPTWEKQERAIDMVRIAETSARTGDTKSMRRLIRRGLKVDVNLGDGQTLLMVACGHGRTEMARYLVDQGAKINARDIRGETPLSMAAKKGHAGIVRLLVEGRSGQMAADQGVRRRES